MLVHVANSCVILSVLLLLSKTFKARSEIPSPVIAVFVSLIAIMLNRLGAIKFRGKAPIANVCSLWVKGQIFFCLAIVSYFVAAYVAER